MIFKVKGQIFRRVDTPRFALPLFCFVLFLRNESWIEYVRLNGVMGAWNFDIQNWFVYFFNSSWYSLTTAALWFLIFYTPNWYLELNDNNKPDALLQIFEYYQYLVMGLLSCYYFLGFFLLLFLKITCLWIYLQFYYYQDISLWWIFYFTWTSKIYRYYH